MVRFLPEILQYPTHGQLSHRAGVVQQGSNGVPIGPKRQPVVGTTWKQQSFLNLYGPHFSLYFTFVGISLCGPSPWADGLRLWADGLRPSADGLRPSGASVARRSLLRKMKKCCRGFVIGKLKVKQFVSNRFPRTFFVAPAN